MALLHTHLGKHVHQVARAFREGGGVPYAAYRPEFTDVMDAIGRSVYDGLLIDAYLPMVPGLVEQLEATSGWYKDKIRVHFSGCPSSCGQHQIADIGFRGARTKVDGKMVDRPVLLKAQEILRESQRGKS